MYDIDYDQDSDLDRDSFGKNILRQQQDSSRHSLDEASFSHYATYYLDDDEGQDEAENSERIEEDSCCSKFSYWIKSKISGVRKRINILSSVTQTMR